MYIQPPFWVDDTARRGEYGKGEGGGTVNLYKMMPAASEKRRVKYNSTYTRAKVIKTILVLRSEVYCLSVDVPFGDLLLSIN